MLDIPGILLRTANDSVKACMGALFATPTGKTCCPYFELKLYIHIVGMTAMVHQLHEVGDCNIACT